MENIPISPQGLELIKQELERLKKERPAIIQAIKEAREEGDLSENAGYHAARERQGMIEAKISLLESKMAHFNVVNPDNIGKNGVAVYGAAVTVEDSDTGERKEFILLGPDETEHVAGGISVLSPVGKALLGHGKGDEVTVRVPRGKIVYEIVSVEFRDLTSMFAAGNARVVSK